MIVMVAESKIKPNRTKRWEGMNTDLSGWTVKRQGIKLNKSVHHVRDTKIVCSPLEKKIINVTKEPLPGVQREKQRAKKKNKKNAVWADM